jgi:hypothetical protein
MIQSRCGILLFQFFARSVQVCQPGTGSLCRSRSKNSSLPAHREYLGVLILNQVLGSGSGT